MKVQTAFLTKEKAYSSPHRPILPLARLNPSVLFYAHVLKIIYKAAHLCRRGKYTGANWVESSLDTIAALEKVGGRFELQNLDIVPRLSRPCVFIANHMSILETFVLPCLIQPHRNVTFVVKESLMAYPFFKHVLHSRQPIVVGRANPREDFKVVMAEGRKRLEDLISVVVFPQTTRSIRFDPAKFNSLGVKLAKRCGAPVVPIALKTDAWGVGRIFKDCGKIRPEKTVRICFHEPLLVQRSGRETHMRVVEFIDRKLKSWTE